MTEVHYIIKIMSLLKHGKADSYCRASILKGVKCKQEKHAISYIPITQAQEQLPKCSRMSGTVNQNCNCKNASPAAFCLILPDIESELSKLKHTLVQQHEALGSKSLPPWARRWGKAARSGGYRHWPASSPASEHIRGGGRRCPRPCRGSCLPWRPDGKEEDAAVRN